MSAKPACSYRRIADAFVVVTPRPIVAYPASRAQASTASIRRPAGAAPARLRCDPHPVQARDPGAFRHRTAARHAGEPAVVGDGHERSPLRVVEAGAPLPFRPDRGLLERLAERVRVIGQGPEAQRPKRLPLVGLRPADLHPGISRYGHRDVRDVRVGPRWFATIVDPIDRTRLASANPPGQHTHGGLDVGSTARSALSRMLREASAAGGEAAATGVPIDEVSGPPLGRHAELRDEAREAAEAYNDAVRRTAERGGPDDLAARWLAMDHLRHVDAAAS